MALVLVRKLSWHLVWADFFLDSWGGGGAAAIPAGACNLSFWGVVLEGTRCSSQLAMDAVAVTILCDAASLSLPAGVAGTKATSLSLARVVLVVLGCDDFHLRLS